LLDFNSLISSETSSINLIWFFFFV
jgi:hypothetical protein